MPAGKPTVFELRLPPLSLEAGGSVDPLVVRGWWWGPEGDARTLEARACLLSDDQGERDANHVIRRTRAELTAVPIAQDAPPPAPAVPTVVLVHALTGDMRAGGSGGWWEPVIGVGKALDPTQVRLLCFNNLGSCYGSSGPADEGFPTTPVTTWDQAGSLLSALDALGIGQVHLATGGSLGAMIVLCLAALSPERVERIAPIAGSEAASAWLIGWNHVAREAVRLDRQRGLELARQLAMLTYRAEAGLHARQGREARSGAGWRPEEGYQVQGWLEHQGEKLRRRFHAEAYLSQLGAMDHHDLGRAPVAHSSADGWGLRRIRARSLVVDIDSDQLYRPEQSERLATRLQQNGVSVERATIHSPHGHDAFLLEWSQLEAVLRRAVAL